MRIGIPDVMVDHATPQQSFETLGLLPDQMAERIKLRFKLAVSALQDTADSTSQVSSVVP